MTGPECEICDAPGFVEVRHLGALVTPKPASVFCRDCWGEFPKQLAGHRGTTVHVRLLAGVPAAV